MTDTMINDLYHMILVFDLIKNKQDVDSPIYQWYNPGASFTNKDYKKQYGDYGMDK